MTIDSDENTAAQKLEDHICSGASPGNEAILKPSLESIQHSAIASSKSEETVPTSYSIVVPGGSKHEDSPLYDCPLCPFQTASEGQIVQHFNNEHNFLEDGATDFENPLLYSCPMCCTGFDSPKDLSDHVDKSHLDEDQQENISQGQTHRVSNAENVNGLKKKTLDQHSGKRSSNNSTSSLRKGRLECMVCGIVMDHEDQNLMAKHVDKHFQSASREDSDWQFAQKLQSEEQQRVQVDANQLEQQKTKYGMNTRLTARQQFDRDLERAVSAGSMTVSEFLERKASQTKSSQSGVDDGYTRVTGVIQKLMTYYVSGSRPRNVSRTYLCSPLHHYSSSFGDRGWGCGYRNFQMLLSCLMTDATYLNVLFNGQPKMPSILKLQQLIENAWKEGFDPHGSMQLEGRVVNTRKWIGATEIVAVLSSLHVKCQLLDFNAPSGKDNTHPVMINWVRAYFKDSNNFKPPLYLQHQGHSRTIIGVEELHNGSCNLLLFDPGTQKSRMELFHGKIDYNTMQTIRRGLHAFRALQYQIVAVVGLLNDTEFQVYKIMRSQRLS
ncbi:zinc finger with UFM1-specific peptidase domain protein-like [Pomacea canaliculata]|uniref:zinc finger with UFM1-specific peptidase domain protein-like n=1 Tax=Pomacea canaliculata TaxID=400727 RepID=UPI000D738CAA|nr:zinc finger with UFM1-specific peptidase domain protein-like [Pomacea canaliculata]